MQLLSLFIAIILLFNPPPKVDSTKRLVELMQRTYKGKWAYSLTFTQHNTHYKGDTVSDTSVWYEAIKYPDKFRIDFGEPAAGNAVIFSNDSVYQFKDGTLKTNKLQPNYLMLLAGGIYFMNLEEALQRLKDAGYNIDVFGEDTWQGKPVYIVGAKKGDQHTPQFWIDQKHLYLVRTITSLPDKHLQDARFGKHIRTAGGWTETEVLFLLDGKLVQAEEYKHIQADAHLPEGLFSPHKFGKVHWLP